MNSSGQNNASSLQKGEYQTQWTTRTSKKSLSSRSSNGDGRSSELGVSQLNMYGNRTASSNTNLPPSATSSALLVLPQPINAAMRPPGLTATNITGRKYQCKMCPQVFMHKSAMQQHSREIHRDEIKPHQCQQCLKSFSSTHQLTQHIRIHTGEKPYKCSYCDRRFKQLSHVQQHTRLHTGERPYKCHLPNCGRTFTQLSILQQHLKNHDTQMERAKNRPYVCSICGKGFASEVSLITHRSKMCVFLQQRAALIGGANFQSCPVCYKICLNGEALMEHTQTTHKDLNLSSTPSLLHHMESMRMEPSHQFAAQYMLSRAAAERREKATSGSISTSAMSITSESTSSSNTGSMDYQEQASSTSSHQSIPSTSCPHPLQLTEEETQRQLTTQFVLGPTTTSESTEKGPTAGMAAMTGSTINATSDSRSPSNTSGADFQGPIASTNSHQQIIPSASCTHSLQLPGQGQQ